MANVLPQPFSWSRHKRSSRYGNRKKKTIVVHNTLKYVFIVVLDTRHRCFNMEFAGFGKYDGG